MKQDNQDNQSSALSGFLVIGVSNTYLFSGETACELLLLNLSTGEDFAMPITEEQAAMIASIANDSLVEDEPEPDSAIISPKVFRGIKEAPQL
jgi:hypothetical protein